MNRPVLRIGATGQAVRELQELLSLRVDGQFGPITDRAVKEFQRDNRLKIDGVVGPKTWAALSLSTDLSEEMTCSDELVINNHFLPPGEFFAGPTKKDWLFLHHTAGWDNPYNTVNNWARDDRGAVATEFLVGGQRITNQDATHDGTVVKCMPDGGWGWHLGVGRRRVHTDSVGIELNSFGYLTKGGWSRNRQWVARNPDKFYTYVGTESHDDQVFDLGEKFRGHMYWHRYSDAQIESTKKLILFIAQRDNIDVRAGLPDLIRKHGAVKAFDYLDLRLVERTPGLWCHTNVSRGKFDLFPQPEVVEMLLSL